MVPNEQNAKREPRGADAVARKRIKIGLVQMRSTASKSDNVESAVAHIAEAAGRGADVVCLQELFATPYPAQSEDHGRFDDAEPIPGPTSERLARAASENQLVVVGSLFERRAAGVYHNTAVIFDADGTLVGRYRKMHIPDDPLYYEKFYFTPGDLGFRAFSTVAGKIGVCVCWDGWFPEAARLTALAGAEVIFYPTAIGWQPEDGPDDRATMREAWETVMRSHAIANGLFVAAVNRTGTEAGLEFWGSSFVCDPNGKVLARASQDEEALLIAKCDLNQIEAARTHWPFLRDRRIDAYGDMTRRLID